MNLLHFEYMDIIVSFYNDSLLLYWINDLTYDIDKMLNF